MNNSIIKDYYRLNEICAFLSENLNQSFTTFDILFSICERDIKLCFYYSGFIGVSEWDRMSGENVNRRIPFDGVLEIVHIMHIQETLNTSEIFVSSIKPYYWVRHKDKQVRLNEEILKFNEPNIYMVNYHNQITSNNLKMDMLIVPSNSLVDLLRIFKKRISTNFFEDAEKPLNLSFDKTSNTHPHELDLAIQAWQAVSSSEGKGKPKARIRKWLDDNTKLSDAAKERICIVCNWEKLGGATSTN